MKLILIALILFLLILSPAPAQAVGTCPGADTALVRVAFFHERSAGFYAPGRSVEFPVLVDLHSLFSGSMTAVYDEWIDGKLADYWLMSDRRKYFAAVQSYPYLIEFYAGKYDGQSECQYLIGTSAEYPDLAFVYVFRDYWQQWARGVDVHPVSAHYMPLRALTDLIGTTPAHKGRE